MQIDKREYAVKWKNYDGITVEPHQNLNEQALQYFHQFRDAGVKATLSEVGTCNMRRTMVDDYDVYVLPPLAWRTLPWS